MKVSYKELIKFDQASAGYLAQDKEKDTKLAYALGRINKQLPSIVEKFQLNIREKTEDLQLEFALTEPPNDPKGKILRNDKGGYEFTKEDESKLKKALRELQKSSIEEKGYTVTEYFATSIPEDLTDEQLEAFSGIVIREEVVAEMLAKREEERIAKLEGPSKPWQSETPVLVPEDQEATAS